MPKPRATQADVDAFIKAICPNAPELYKMASSEKTCLNDAASLLVRYRSALMTIKDALEAEAAINIHAVATHALREG